MLYPNLNELLAYKARSQKLALTPSSINTVGVSQGDIESSFRGQGLEFDAVREYFPGDDVRNIDWRVTARTGAAHLKVFREERERNVLLVVDMNSTMRFGTRGTFKSIQAARLSSLLSFRALSNHNKVGACLFGDVKNKMQFFAPKRTRQSIWEMLQIFCKPPSETHSVSLEETLMHINLAAQTGSLIYVISDFMHLTEGIEKVLNRLCMRCDIVFLTINDPADHTIKPIDSVIFSSDNKEKVIVNTDSLVGRKNYEMQWQNNRYKLNKISSKYKIPVISLTTEKDILFDLSIGLKKIAKKKGRR